MTNENIYYVKKEERYKNSDMYWWNIRPSGCSWTDRYLAFDFKEAVQRYKAERSVKMGKFVLEQ
jgi:hypothetical protein